MTPPIPLPPPRPRPPRPPPTHLGFARGNTSARIRAEGVDPLVPVPPRRHAGILAVDDDDDGGAAAAAEWTKTSVERSIKFITVVALVASHRLNRARRHLEVRADELLLQLQDNSEGFSQDGDAIAALDQVSITLEGLRNSHATHGSIFDERLGSGDPVLQSALGLRSARSAARNFVSAASHAMAAVGAIDMSGTRDQPAGWRAWAVAYESAARRAMAEIGRELEALDELRQAAQREHDQALSILHP